LAKLCAGFAASNNYDKRLQPPLPLRDNVNPKLKALMKELGEAINESLSESEPISEVIGKIKAGGYDVFLVLEATIGFNKTDEAEANAVTATGARKEPEFKISSQDMKFLKSLRISLDEAA
jgi:hypothetical protein